MRKLVFPAAIALFLATVATAFAAPCDEVDRGLSNELKSSLSAAIANHLRSYANISVKKPSEVDVRDVFRAEGWSIIYVETPYSDPVYLFYKDDPLKNRYLTLWAGEATPDQEKAIADWVLANAPGIPEKLARCFAWHVTKDPDM